MRSGCAVVIFAYNEERGIGRALYSVLANLPPVGDTRIHVMANGCTDRTVEVVRAIAQQHPCVNLLVIELPDKCNAWNTYVHDIADDCPIHFFMDGDLSCSPNAFGIMASKLDAVPHANAVAGVPQSGRNRDVYVGCMQRWGWVFGNLYAVRGAHLERIRQAKLRLPLGLRGNDHIITRLMHSDLAEPWAEKPERVTFDLRAGYVFERLKPYLPRDVRLYYRRMITYRWRQLQLARMAKIPLVRLPPDMSEIDRDILAELRARPPRPWDHFTRQVVRRLHRRYGRPTVSEPRA